MKTNFKIGDEVNAMFPDIDIVGIVNSISSDSSMLEIYKNGEFYGWTPVIMCSHIIEK